MLEVSFCKQFPGFSLETEFSLGRKTMLLCGPSGSGKTTLLRCLAGLEQPDKGYIIFDGDFYFRKNSISISPPFRRTALMSQENTLFPHLTVRQNMLYSVPRSKETPDLYHELLHKLYLSPQENCFPEALSGGEKRRVMLARTLLRQPDLLLLDEPFTGLEAEMCQKVSTLLYNYFLNYKPVFIIASHIKQELICWADQRLTLQGKSTVAAS